MSSTVASSSRPGRSTGVALPSDSNDRIVRQYKRSREGCFTCRLRRKKCDENHPRCNSCTNLDITCDYDEPPWWRSLAARDIHKERIKRQIRFSRVRVKEKNLQDFTNRTLAGSRRRRVNSNSPPPDASSSAEYTPYLNAPALPRFGSDLDNEQLSWQTPMPSTSYTLMGPRPIPGQFPLPEMSHQPSQPVQSVYQPLAPLQPPQLPLEMPQQFSDQLLQTPTLPASQQFSPPVTQQFPQTFSQHFPAQFQEPYMQHYPQHAPDSSAQQFSQQIPPQMSPQFSDPTAQQFSQQFSPQVSQQFPGPSTQPLPQHVLQQYPEQQFQQQLPPQPPASSSTLPSNDWPQSLPGDSLAQGTIESREEDDTEEPLTRYMETENPKDAERPLLHHFVDNVLKLIFPILDLHPQIAPRSREILQSLETNKPYFHCCLSVSALHIKTITAGTSFRTEKKVIDDIMRHRYASISELCDALNSDEHHDKVLNATLATILFHCAVGEPDDYLPDIPWYEHFTPVADLVSKLGLIEPAPFTPLPFSMSLTSWIDILGATMLGRSPQFAHVYRAKYSKGVSSALRDLMGCDDGVMYLISEIGCLESLKRNGLEEDALRFHISALAAQLDRTDTQAPENPCSRYGIISPEKLTRNITGVFRAAARVYLCTLAPGFERNNQSVANLVQAVVDALHFVPMGPYGYDRSLVWPLLMTGVCSTPESGFRKVLAQRATELDETAEYGSFGRMYRVLKETWKLSDDPTTSVYDEANYMLPSMNLVLQGLDGVTPTIGTIGRPIKKQAVHWRDVMHRNGWHYLLL
ncbi:hypothetical protein BO78DRAFT_419276 [Aspergillus sclerotiicarbonarius CBS 121057]|uniref:Zn(2)-C6 fungal-type domain-containing protein n=1 Tax=Aspergillus sclerotiicarbonarius (strain CBS 121057 / IBT 28362) TaxID=1448318 RepID=A0A319E6L9_ASPSB|nr:hypothetical protein BO78DRAFT_419276 [Aspergillus sclerotiicarbonarius CBS 121057]